MSVAACAAIVERGDPDRFLAAMAAPPALRARLFPLYAYNVEIARAPWVTAEPLIAEMRLQWWRDALAEIAEGRPPRAHEVAAPLAQVIRDHHLPLDLLDGMAAARRWDIDDAGFADAAALRAHLDATGGALMWLTARALGAAESDEAAVRAVGRAGALAAWFLAVPDLQDRGRDPLPPGAPVAALAADALAALATARPLLPRSLAPALRAAWRARDLLGQAIRDPAAVPEGRLGTSEFRRRVTLLSRTLRGGW